MLHPVGPRTPAVYWRRRLLALATLVLVGVLIVLTAKAVFGSGGTPAADGTHPSTSSRATDPPPTPTPSGGTPSNTVSSNTVSRSTPAGTKTTKTGTAVPPRCTPGQLSVQAVVGKPSYAVGDNPVLTLQVTNTGTAPCVQDVADGQIELRVYNGASRVWGSHDCKTEPGVQDRILVPNKPAGFSIVWSGLTAQPGCAGTRQRVGAGTYTLYASLSGQNGKATQFTIK